MPRLDEGISLLHDLAIAVVEELHPPGGPHALFHHVSHCLERIRDVKLVLRRIGENRHRLRELYQQEESLRVQWSTGSSIPHELNPIYTEREEQTARMKVDYESLYIFANLALDQWAHLVFYLVGNQDEIRHPFHRLVTELRSSRCRVSLRPLRESHVSDAIWLYYHIRFYRNVFIEHVARPWQRGTTMSLEGEDLSFHSPTPPGWLSSAIVRSALEGLDRLAPPWLQQTPPEWWERSPQRVLEIAFRHIDELESQTDQERVWNAWRTVGGSTVSFDVLAGRFMRFLVGGTMTIRHIALGNPTAIKLGEPGGMEELNAEMRRREQQRP